MLIKHETPHGSWVHRSTFVMASTGAIIGLANFWRFPYVMAENGGPWFFLAYLGFLLFFSAPLLYTEMLIGRIGRCSPIGGMRLLAQDFGTSKHWIWAGGVGTAAGLLTLALYSVVSGMTLSYIFKAAFGEFTDVLPNQVALELSELRNNRSEMLAWEMIFLLGVLTILARGVNKGIGRAARYLMPLFFLILTALLVFSLRQGDVEATRVYLFSDASGGFSWRGLILALQHAFFTLGIGMGAMMAYGAYSPGSRALMPGVFMVVGFDLLISLIAGFMIFPLIFATGLGPTHGFDLMFRTMPMAFGQLPGGQFFAAMFFVLMTLAAWSSAISLGEPLVAWLIERFRMRRLFACVLLVVLAGAIGQALTLTLGALSEWSWWGISLFSLYEVVVSGLLIPGAALFIALYIGRAVPEQRLREVVTEFEPGWFYLVWYFLVRFVAPVLVVILMITGLTTFVASACERSAELSGGICRWLEIESEPAEPDVSQSKASVPADDVQLPEEIDDQDH